MRKIAHWEPDSKSNTWPERQTPPFRCRSVEMKRAQLSNHAEEMKSEQFVTSSHGLEELMLDFAGNIICLSHCGILLSFQSDQCLCIQIFNGRMLLRFHYKQLCFEQLPDWHFCTIRTDSLVEKGRQQNNPCGDRYIPRLLSSQRVNVLFYQR